MHVHAKGPFNIRVIVQYITLANMNLASTGVAAEQLTGTALLLHMTNYTYEI